MRSDYLPEDLKKIWKELASNPVQVSADDLRRESRKLRTGVGFRNWVVVGGNTSPRTPLLHVLQYCPERIGSLLSIATANAIVQF